MARLAKAAGAKVLILGMQLPPNYGRAYGDRFAALFADVARTEGAALVPFMLKGVADGPAGGSRCSRPTASIRSRARIRRSWPTSGRCSRRC